MAIVQVQAPCKEYRAGRGRRTVALDGVDFEVPDGGGVFAFVGPNGAGNTTTIRCLLNLIRPTGGGCLELGVDPQVHFRPHPAQGRGVDRDAGPVPAVLRNGRGRSAALAGPPERAALAPFAATDATGWDWFRTTAALAGRVATVAGGAAALGYAIALMGRGTAAALGGGLAYVLVIESVLGSNCKPVRPWLMLDHAIVFVKGQFEGDPGSDVPGRTVMAAAVVPLVYLAAALLTAATTFTRRDVT